MIAQAADSRWSLRNARFFQMSAGANWLPASRIAGHVEVSRAHSRSRVPYDAATTIERASTERKRSVESLLIPVARRRKKRTRATYALDTGELGRRPESRLVRTCGARGPNVAICSFPIAFTQCRKHSNCVLRQADSREKSFLHRKRHAIVRAISKPFRIRVLLKPSTTVGVRGTHQETP